MPELNPLFRAHMLLYRWGCEAEARLAADGDGSEAVAQAAAGDGPEGRRASVGKAHSHELSAD